MIANTNPKYKKGTKIRHSNGIEYIVLDSWICNHGFVMYNMSYVKTGKKTYHAFFEAMIDKAEKL